MYKTIIKYFAKLSETGAKTSKQLTWWSSLSVSRERTAMRCEREEKEGPVESLLLAPEPPSSTATVLRRDGHGTQIYRVRSPRKRGTPRGCPTGAILHLRGSAMAPRFWLRHLTVPMGYIQIGFVFRRIQKYSKLFLIDLKRKMQWSIYHMGCGQNYLFRVYFDNGQKRWNYLLN